MIDRLMGLPAHPLIVHAAVIFGPLLVLAVLAYSLVPALRGRIGWLVLALSVIAPASLWLAKLSGEEFLERQKAAGAQGQLITDLNEHANFGDMAAWLGLALGVLGIVEVLYLNAASKKPATTGSRVISYGLMAVSVVVAVALSYYLFKVGHSGATIVWKNSP